MRRLTRLLLLASHVILIAITCGGWLLVLFPIVFVREFARAWQRRPARRRRRRF